MKELIGEGELCVLATGGPQGPYCSLMSYLAGEDCRELYFLTSPHSRKFANLRAEPRVSLLLDDRGRKGGSSSEILSLTLSGVAEVVEEAGPREGILGRFDSERPRLRELSAKSDTQVIKVRLGSALLLEGVAQGSYLSLA